MFEPATRVRVLEVPVMLRVAPKIEEAFRVVTFVVERFEAAVTLRVDAKRLTAFMMATLPVVNTFRVSIFARV